ncbi:uncharacterized protein LOC142231304 [Haematobia irritans]|uniref:uncharacterized protein LOC142231304 n=1 Tax=Haematobia irritans TaxID=7368 RepID=UPI003F4F978D
MPLRPIVSSINVPCYGLSKYIGQILRKLVSEKYNIKNSLQLKNNLKDLILDKNEILVSFDVISLFTNIPIHTAIQIIMKKWDIINDITKIPRSKFLEILKFCLMDNNYFIFDNHVYKQVFGMPMGNPPSPTIADIVLDNLLDEALTELREKNIHIKHISKYVDDILAIIKMDETDEILKVFNSYHTKLQFTIEMEHNKQIAYLDTKLHHRENEIKFDWFSKETSSGRIINFNSTQPRNQITNTAKSLIRRILSISDEEFHGKNFKIISRILSTNSFPKKLIEELINEIKGKIKHDSQELDVIKGHNDATAETVFYSVRYVPGLTDKKHLKPIIQTNNICFAYKPNSTLSCIFSKVKSPIDKQQQSNVVYEIPCRGNNNEPCDLLYIGTTKRNLHTRVNEHRMDIEKKKESTALSQHILRHGHTADFENVRILERENKERKRLTLESLRIQQNIDRTMNVKEDTDNLSVSYRVAIS